ncbi:MAG: helix-turn-helix transcriptional regulator [Spirochaetaceae bacterium]|nr:helix-turn-helix transcriptional regulator [Spirochaetaceae bacterium]
MKQTEGSLLLRKLLAANIKERRSKLAISQERLAELADVSVQTVNFIEGCRTWVSDKTLAKLAGALRVDAYRLLLPVSAATASAKPESTVSAQVIHDLRSDILNDIDRRFEDIIRG